MISINIFYKEIEGNLHSAEKAYIEFDTTFKRTIGTPEFDEVYTKFTFVVDEKTTYTIKTISKSNINQCWTQPLYLNDEKVEHSAYQIIIDDFDEEYTYTYTIEDEDDSCG